MITLTHYSAQLRDASSLPWGVRGRALGDVYRNFYAGNTQPTISDIRFTLSAKWSRCGFSRWADPLNKVICTNASPDASDQGRSGYAQFDGLKYPSITPIPSPQDSSLRESGVGEGQGEGD